MNLDHLSEETKRKLKTGVILLCECGTTHNGKHPKCLKCMSRTCENCNKSYFKGGLKLCNHCINRRNKRSRL